MTEHRLLLRKVKTGEEYALTGVVPVGREVPEGIKLVDDGVSRRHATLSVVDGTVYLEDAGSRNGTFLNANPVTARTALRFIIAVTVSFVITLAILYWFFRSRFQ